MFSMSCLSYNQDVVIIPEMMGYESLLEGKLKMKKNCQVKDYLIWILQSCSCYTGDCSIGEEQGHGRPAAEGLA